MVGRVVPEIVRGQSAGVPVPRGVDWRPPKPGSIGFLGLRSVVWREGGGSDTARQSEAPSSVVAWSLRPRRPGRGAPQSLHARRGWLLASTHISSLSQEAAPAVGGSVRPLGCGDTFSCHGGRTATGQRKNRAQRSGSNSKRATYAALACLIRSSLSTSPPTRRPVPLLSRLLSVGTSYARRCWHPRTREQVT